MNALKEIAEQILGSSLKSEDGIDEDEITTLEKLLGVNLPHQLKDFYRLVGNLGLFMSSFQHFIEPYIKDDKLIFLEENQSVCYWAVDLDCETVFMSTDLETDRPEWFPEEVTLSNFLTIIMYYQAAQGGYDHGGAVYETNFEDKDLYLQFLTDATRDYAKVVDHNGLVIYQNNGKLIWYFTNSEGSADDTIFASTRTAKDMKVLEKYGFSEL